MRISMVSEHASPLAVLGGADAGGQNVHVAALAQAMARRGAEVVVHTRRDDADLPEYVELCPGVLVHHVDAGPPRSIPKDDLLEHMPAFGARAAGGVAPPSPRRRPRALLDVGARRRCPPRGRSGCPSCRRSTRSVRSSAATRARRTRARRSGWRSSASSPRRRTTSSRRARTRCSSSCASAPIARTAHRDPLRGRPRPLPAGRPARDARPPGVARLLSIGRLVERKGIGNAIEALAGVPGAELVVVGGPDRDRRSPTTPRRAGCCDIAPTRGRRRPRRAARARRRARTCRRSSARRTPWSRVRGTSRSGSCRWRRWPAACRWSPRPSAG